ncbi:MAG TPA: hypothetical protein VFW87_08985 [Pirellulales bacterium]|nr:hypothetical protein [Pirellulales bacterium]
MTRWLPSFTTACFCGVLLTGAAWLAWRRPTGGLAPSTVHAQTAPPHAHADAQAQRLLARAAETLTRRKSVSAELSQTVRLYGQELLARGSYVQGPARTGWLLLDLKIKADKSDSFVQQRCDGESLWTLRSADGLPSLSRVDVRRVTQRRAETSGLPMPMIGVGGLPELLLGLQRSFEYDAVNEATLTRGSEKLRVYALSGRWRPAMLVHWLPDQKADIEAGKPADLSKLPPMLPDRVFVLLGRDDLFLYRVEYVREATDKKSREGEGPFVSFNLAEVVFDQPVERRQFAFERGTLPAVDATDAYLARQPP